jgi:ribosome biogenesis GTPase
MPPVDPEQLLTSGQLGPEQIGVIVSYYGRQADVVPADRPGAPLRRCYLRANLMSLVTGDQIRWRDGEHGGVITAVMPRASLLERPDPGGRRRPIAANIDRIAIVVAPIPLPHANLIDRYLVAAEDQRIQPLLIANKADLPSAELMPLRELLAPYPALGYEVVWVSAKTRAGVDQLSTALADHTSVLVGQSGVGKSSLINTLYPQAEAAVGALSERAAKGRHTTSAARLFVLPDGGRLIDSPGIREFGLWHLDERQVFEGFIEFRPFLGHCRFRDCRHDNEPDCALRTALADGLISQRRLDSCRQIVRSLTEV